jgi:ankyrin repeat protein
MRFALVLSLAAATAHAQTSAELNAAATRSVQLLESVTSQWKLPCFSCHHQALPAMAFDTARRHGIAINETAAQARSNRAFAVLSNIDQAVQDTFLIDPSLSEGYQLVAAHSAGVTPSLTTAIYARRIANLQRKDGHWATFDSRPPQSCSLFSATAIAARSVSLYMPAEFASEQQAVLDRARAWLASNKTRDTEDAVFQLLGLSWTGARPPELQKYAAGLIALQREDGGWAQLPERSSDAYATGTVLYALQTAAGLPPDHATIRKGLAYLLKTQAPDGSWHVESRINTPAPVSPPYFESGFPHKHDQWISTAATAWAVIAISESLPAAPKSPLPVTTAAPKGEAAWMRTALFGSVAELKKLLDSGLSANSAAPEGTTLLMMAVNDPAKLKLLFARGADVRKRAESGFDALMVASLFQGNAESIRMLLDKGISPKARPGVRFDASPIAIASLVGDPDAIELLLKRGADPNVRMKLLGLGPDTPLKLAMYMDYADSVRVLAKHGANINYLDDDKMSPLSWAALSHKPAATQVLLDLGVDMKHIDRFGLTPTDHVKGIYFGDDGFNNLFAATSSSKAASK